MWLLLAGLKLLPRPVKAKPLPNEVLLGTANFDNRYGATGVRDQAEQGRDDGGFFGRSSGWASNAWLAAGHDTAQ
jgi:hypothetical protein